LEDIRKLLKAGADKVSINTAAVKESAVRREGLQTFWKPMYRHRHRWQKEKGELGSFYPWRKGSHRNGCSPLGKRAEEMGAGEILLTSMDRDGTKDGYGHRINANDFRTGGHPHHRLRRCRYPRTSL